MAIFYSNSPENYLLDRIEELMEASEEKKEDKKGGSIPDPEGKNKGSLDEEETDEKDDSESEEEDKKGEDDELSLDDNTKDNSSDDNSDDNSASTDNDNESSTDNNDDSSMVDDSSGGEELPTEKTEEEKRLELTLYKKSVSYRSRINELVEDQLLTKLKSSFSLIGETNGREKVDAIRKRLEELSDYLEMFIRRYNTIELEKKKEFINHIEKEIKTNTEELGRLSEKIYED